MNNFLLDLQCKDLPAGFPPLEKQRVQELLMLVPEWVQKDTVILRTFSFKDYYQTIAFVNAVAFICHQENHHPDLSVGYNSCRIEFSTHSVGGLSENDFICAAKIDAL